MNFVKIQNDLVSDTTLSPYARLILIYLLTKPKDWNVNKEDIQRSCLKKSLKTIGRALHELSLAGYAICNTKVKKYVNKAGNVCAQLDGQEYDIYQIKQMTKPDETKVKPDETFPDETFPAMSGFVQYIKKDNKEKEINTTKEKSKFEEKKEKIVVVNFSEKSTMLDLLNKHFGKNVDTGTFERWYSYYADTNTNVSSPIERWSASFKAWEAKNPPPAPDKIITVKIGNNHAGDPIYQQMKESQWAKIQEHKNQSYKNTHQQYKNPYNEMRAD